MAKPVACFHTGSGAPLKIVIRAAAAIDRLTGVADPHRIACLEFAPNAGFWGCFAVEDAIWEARVKSAFRLLADSGFGGEKFARLGPGGRAGIFRRFIAAARRIGRRAWLVAAIAVLTACGRCGRLVARRVYSGAARRLDG